jgi:uncharacterized glyoxalase superfamily protein PhnB
MSFVHNSTFGHPSDVFSKINSSSLAVAFGFGTCQTFFSPRFGMVADKFGVPWMVLVPQQH